MKSYFGIIALLVVFTGGITEAETAVWRISDGAGQLFLGGTVHLLRPSDYPLPSEFDEAYGISDELYFETDISAMNDMAIQAQMLQELTYSDGRTLKSVLDDEAYAALQIYMAQLGLPLAMMETFKPGLIVSTLQVLHFQSMGFTPQGVDVHFSNRAQEDGKLTGELETIAEQIGFIAAMGEGNESEFILLSLEDLREMGDYMEDMIQAWRVGDNDQLEELFVAEMASEAPDIYDALLVQRNNNWLPQIESMLDDSDIEFVLVGAAHLVGNDGLLALLSSKGYTVEQL